MSDVHARILKAAIAAFGERGYGSTTIREVAAGSGVTNPAIYYHFHSKEALYRAAVDEVAGRMEATTTARLRAPGALRERLLGFIRAYLELAEDHPSAARLLLYTNHRPAADEPQIDILEHHRDSEDALLVVVREGVSAGQLRPDLDLEAFLVSLHGATILMMWLVLADQPHPADLGARVLTSLLRGVARG